VDYWWCLSYTLFGLVWFTIYIIWSRVGIYLIHCGLGDLDSGLLGKDWLGYSATYAPCVPLSPLCVSMVYFHASHCIYTRREMSDLLVNEWCAFFFGLDAKNELFFYSRLNGIS
jgi:hypothetical protein